MLATFACAAGICGLSLGTGRLVWRLAGMQRWTWLAPGAGFAALVCISMPAVRLPGHGWTALAVLVCLAAAGVALPKRDPGPDPSRDQAGRVRAWEAITAGLIVLAGASIPFVVSGRFGILGAGLDDDFGFHLAWAEALADGHGADSLIGQVDAGYPIGPHSLAAALASPFGVIPAFTGLLMATPVLTAIIVLSALPDLRPGWRIAGAVATAFPYMVASYFAEGSYKEPLLALVVLTFTLSLACLNPPASWRAGLVPAVAGVAAMLIFGRAGLVWPIAVAALWLAAELIARLDWRRWLSGIAPALVGGGVLYALGVLTDIGRLKTAALSGPFLNADAEGGPGGNFTGQISPLRVLGGWPAANFRLPPEHEVAVAIATAVALLTVCFAGVWWVRRRDLAVPAAAVASLLIYWYARGNVAPYFSAKALVVAAPLLTLLAVRATLANLPSPERPRDLLRGPRRGVARAALGVAFLGVVAWSSLLALEHGEVSEQAHADQLRSLRSTVQGEPTLLLDTDDYAIWELRGARLSSLTPYQYDPDPPATPRPGVARDTADFDSVTSAALDRFRFAITVRGPYASEAPRNWRLVRSTDSFDLWERTGPTPPRETVPGGEPQGSTLDCSTPKGRALSASSGVAAVRPAPVIGPPAEWSVGPQSLGVDPNFQGVGIHPGLTVQQWLSLPPGRWDLSLRYQSSVSLRLEAGGARTTLPPVTELFSQYWPTGLALDGGRSAHISLHASSANRGAMGRVVLLGAVVATPAPWPETRIPLKDACGRYVDWFRRRAG